MPIVSSKGIAQFTGSFTAREFKHLYRRTHFGLDQNTLASGSSLSLAQCITNYLKLSPEPAPPVNYYQATKADPVVPLGQTWVTAPANGDFNGLRTLSFKRWMISNCYKDTTITEKMTMFLHSFLPINTDVGDPRYLYNNYIMLRRNCLGNFKTIIKQLSIDPGMLRFLNGYLNQKNAPDENYARELMELFTLGKGYSPIYSESDIQEAAKVLTGYQVDTATATYKFTSSRHDTTNKTFSAFFNNTIITGKTGTAGETELDDVLTMIFAKDEASEYFVRRLYKFFLYYDIDATVEANVIKPLALIMRQNNYEILPVITAFFNSEHFYDGYSIGSNIKQPLDFILGYAKEMKIALPAESDVAKYYTIMGEFHSFCTLLLEDPYDPASVSGWEAFYQFPNYHENWINTDTIQKRSQLSTYMLVGYTKSGFKVVSDYLEVTKGFANPSDPNLLTEQALGYLHSIDSTAAQKAKLKNYLLFGQSDDYYWTNAWNDHISDPTNVVKKKLVTDLLLGFYKYMTDLAEYQLI
jgi:uncharacterized protein (DUF1800 family)